MLCYFVGKLNLHSNESKFPNDSKKIEKDDISQKFEHHFEEVKDFIESYSEEFKLDEVRDLLNLVRGNFSEDTEDGQVARLIAKYYSQALEGGMSNDAEFTGEDQALFNMAIKNGSSEEAALDFIENDRLMRKFPTRYPDFLNLEFIKSVEKQKRRSPHDSPIDHPRSLHENHIPSEAKLEEMIANNDEFGFNFETKAGGNLYARHSVMPGYLFTRDEIIDIYRDVIKVRNDKNELHDKISDLKKMVWEKLNDTEKGKLGDDMDTVTLHLETAVKGKNKRNKTEIPV
jgi:hypothetical protein